MTDHIHEREAGHHLSSLLGAPTDGLKVAFVPTAGSWSSGIISVASVPLKEKMRASDIKELYMEKYKGEKTINVQNDVVQLIHVGNKHGWSVGGIQGGLDNLLKGAATQCIQNLNLSLGLDEPASLRPPSKP